MSEEIIDVDEPTPAEILAEAQETQEVDDTPVTKVLLEIKHSKGEEPQYVIRISDPDNLELHGTLFASEEHIASAFGNFITHHLTSKGI